MWRKSTHSGTGNCAEVWRKSTHSGTGNCAEVGQDGTVVLVRDTQDRGGPVLKFSPGSWTAFAAGLESA